MIKKLIALLVFVVIAFNSYGQTIVSTSPENKKVILEEFTGIYCVYCPQGHTIAQGIKDAHPDDAFLINIHVGGFADPNGSDPDFRSPYGLAIVGQTGLLGYPAGTINRRNFPGLEQGSSGTTAISRGGWVNASSQTFLVDSYVNVGVEAEIDIQTDMLTIHVEAYYTGDSPEGTNLLNVALLQNNTLGPQTGGNMGNNYVHQHRLVEMITGQWGVSIPTTTTGTFVDETYTYQIPVDYNGVPTNIIDMEVVAFISETHQEVPSGSGATPTFVGITTTNDASLESIENFDFNCYDTVEPVISVQNLGADTITELAIEYSVNGGTPAIYNWTGSIPSLYTEVIQIDGLAYTPEPSNTLDISLPADEENSNNTGSLTFESVTGTSGTISMILNTDGAGAECTWRITGPSGSTVSQGGPYSNNETVNRQWNFAPDCFYTFTLFDSNGDGGTSVTMTDGLGNQFFETDGTFTSDIAQQFSASEQLGLDNNQLESIVLYPNPTSSALTIANAENASIEVYNMLGQTLYSKTSISLTEQVNVSHFTEGTYFVKLTNGDAVKTSKFIVVKQ